MELRVTLLLLLLLLHKISGEPEEEYSNNATKKSPELEVYFSPHNLLKQQEGTHHIVQWYTTLPGAHRAIIVNEKEMVATVTEFAESYNEFPDEANITGSGYLNVSMLFVGYNNITLLLLDQNNQTLGKGILEVSVLLAYRQLSLIFTYSIGVLIGVVYINMGATLDLQVVKSMVKKPIGPLIGILCQYCLMPIFAFGLAKLYFPDQPLLQLGLFLNGASPGGGQSNIWTYLLGGSLDLSIMMTFTSTIVAFGAVPLWVFALGPQVVSDTSFTIPYMRIFILVVSLIIPCSIGLGIQFFFPKASKFIEKYLLTPMSLFNAIYVMTFGFYANRYIFSLFNWKILLASFSLPVLGYLSGMFFAKIARRPTKEVIAIGIETGVQNANIAIFILKLTLEEPSGDLTVVIPAATAILTPTPLLTVFIIKKIYQCWARSDGKDLPAIEENDDPKAGVQNAAYLEDFDTSKQGGKNGGRFTKKIRGVENKASDFSEERL